MSHAVFTNARLVTRDAEFYGSLAVKDGKIAGVEEGASGIPRAIDCQGDYLIPGLVELHTDHLEAHVQPRPRVRWPPLNAVVAHDAQIAGSGITTVFDSICLGVAEDRQEFLDVSVACVREAKAQNMLRADHFIHLRCEVVHEDVISFFEPYTTEPLLRMVSFMDHTPGQRQWADIEKYKVYYGWRLNMNDQQLDDMIRKRLDQQHDCAERNRNRLLAMIAGREIALASHDDTEPSHVDEAAELGIKISEFPTTRRAAEAAHSHGMRIIMGSPNLVLGGSHSGNVAAMELAEAGLLDALASDYVPSSLLQGAFLLHTEGGFPLPRAIATITDSPARMAGLTDRGALAPGLRADLARVRVVDGVPRAVAVWREGVRVC